MEDGSVYTWGRNDYGQLGIGSNQNQLSPFLTPFCSNITSHDYSSSIHEWLFPLLLEEIESEKSIRKDVHIP